ncbi:MAG: type IV pili twitching motility protein PilT, partial [Lachnospiraceae bacterium]|nr:type IV pili twitching motility protein PilT [Lachnospiraceae bacterium]
QASMRLANVLEALVTQSLSVSANGKMRSAEFEVTLADEELRRMIQEKKWI